MACAAGAGDARLDVGRPGGGMAHLWTPSLQPYRVVVDLVLDWKGNGVFGKEKASTPALTVSSILCRYTCNSQLVWPFTHIYFTIWEKVLGPKGEKGKGLSSSPFLWLMPKGEKVLSPKQKDRTIILKKIVYISNWYQDFSKRKKLFQSIFGLIWKIINWYLIWYLKIFQLVSYLISKLQLVWKFSIDIISLDICFKNEKSCQKPPLKAKGRISPGGAFYVVKGKTFETGGGISNLKNASYNHILIPLTICKRIWKDFSKRFEKETNKWCKSDPKC
jgi:hypothetical protein